MKKILTILLTVLLAVTTITFNVAATENVESTTNPIVEVDEEEKEIKTESIEESDFEKVDNEEEIIEETNETETPVEEIVVLEESNNERAFTEEAETQYNYYGKASSIVDGESYIIVSINVSDNLITYAMYGKTGTGTSEKPQASSIKNNVLAGNVVRLGTSIIGDYEFTATKYNNSYRLIYKNNSDADRRYLNRTKEAILYSPYVGNASSFTLDPYLKDSSNYKVYYLSGWAAAKNDTTTYNLTYLFKKLIPVTAEFDGETSFTYSGDDILGSIINSINVGDDEEVSLSYGDDYSISFKKVEGEVKTDVTEIKDAGNYEAVVTLTEKALADYCFDEEDPTTITISFTVNRMIIDAGTDEIGYVSEGEIYSPKINFIEDGTKTDVTELVNNQKAYNLKFYKGDVTNDEDFNPYDEDEREVTPTDIKGNDTYTVAVILNEECNFTFHDATSVDEKGRAGDYKLLVFEVKNKIKVSPRQATKLVYNGKDQRSRLHFVNNDRHHSSLDEIVNVEYITDEKGHKTSQAKNAGRYYAYLSLNNTKEYEWANGLDRDKDGIIRVEFIVEKKDAYVWVDNYTKYYGQENPAFEVKQYGFVGNEFDRAIKSVSIDTRKPEIAGQTITLYPHVTGNVTVNYNIVSSNGSLYIKKAPLKASLTVNSFIYNKEAQVPTLVTFKGLAKGETLEYGKDYTVKFVKEHNNAVDVGTKTVEISLIKNKKTVNYDMNPVRLTYTITPATVVASLKEKDKSFVYDGNEHKPEPIVKIITGDLKGKELSNKKDYHLEYANVVPGIEDVVNAGEKTVTVTLKSNNYVFNVGREKVSTYTLGYKITPKEVYLRWPTVHYTYNGEIQEPTPIVVNLEKGDKVQTNVEIYKLEGYNTKKVDHSIDAGYYLAKATSLIGKDASNYKLSIKSDNSYSYEINRKPVSITWKYLEFTYDGLVHKPIPMTEDFVENDLKYHKVSLGSRETDGAERPNLEEDEENRIVYLPIDAYDNYYSYAYLKGASKDNYVIVEEDNTKFVIHPRTLRISWGTTSFVENGEIHVPSADVKAAVIKDKEVLPGIVLFDKELVELQYVDGKGGKTKHGSYEAEVELVDKYNEVKKAHNYVIENPKQSFKISIKPSDTPVKTGVE